MGTLRIHAFGGFALYLDEEPLSAFPTQKAQSLFCYLALNPDRPHAREVVAEMLWGNEGTDNARHCLNTALWRVREALRSQGIDPAAYILADRAHVQFNPQSDHWCDVVAFRALLSDFEAARRDEPDPRAWDTRPLRDALELYRAHLLDGCYDDWSLAERERLQQLQLRVLATSMVHQRATGQYDAAIATGQRILALDPLREEVHREVMRCYHFAGRRTDALRQFDACRTALEDELGVEPMPETVSLCGEIREGRLVEEISWAAPVADQTVPSMAQLRTILQQLEDAKQQVLSAMQAVSAVGLEQDGPMSAHQSLG